jgi:hypothetical protein
LRLGLSNDLRLVQKQKTLKQPESLLMFFGAEKKINCSREVG